jgi:hypothetical protein
LLAGILTGDAAAGKHEEEAQEEHEDPQARVLAPAVLHLARYSSSDDRLMRYAAPIFFAVSSPDSITVNTSCSVTPRILATSAGAIS